MLRGVPAQPVVRPLLWKQRLRGCPGLELGGDVGCPEEAGKECKEGTDRPGLWFWKSGF